MSADDDDFITFYIDLQIVEMDEEVQIPVERADKRYFSLGRGGKPMSTLEKNIPHVAAIEPRGLISDVVMQEAALHIYLRSVVQVTLPFSLCFKRIKFVSYIDPIGKLHSFCAWPKLYSYCAIGCRKKIDKSDSWHWNIRESNR